VTERVYVPGYGYVTQGEKGTGETSRPGYVPSRPSPKAPPTGSLRGQPVPGNEPGEPTPTQANIKFFGPPEGVRYPLDGVGGFGGRTGYDYTRRMGYNPDALERFPYGITYRTQAAATGEFAKLDPGYQLHVDAIAKHPNIGTSASTGRKLWERVQSLAAESTELGRPQTPQEILAEIAYNLGMSPSEGRDGSGPAASSGPTYSPPGGGSYGGGGGGGGGGQVSLTNPTSARTLLLQTMQGVLGRNPTNREYKGFLDTLTQTEMANPQTVDVQGDLVVQSGGTDPGSLALEFAQSADDYKSTQANKFYNAFMGALGGNLGG
jgi:hypothetical protein